MQSVIEQCRAFERLAVVVYEGFEANSPDPDQRQFWRAMADDERRHVAFWNDLLDECEQGAVPTVVLRPEATAARLREAYMQAETLSRTLEPFSPLEERFHVAVRLEFHALDPAFEALFRFGALRLGLDDVLSGYDRHIGALGEAMERFMVTSPALQTSVELLQALWQRTQALAIGTVTDELTGLMSRRGLLQSTLTMAHVARRKGFALGVVLVSLDKLGQLNEQRGFEAGDELLKGMADVLKRACRGQDLAGRWASDLLAVVMPDTYHDDLFRSASAFQQQVDGLLDSRPSGCCSIGVASTTVGDDVEGAVQALMAEAERKMLLAKEAGGGRVVG